MTKLDSFLDAFRGQGGLFDVEPNTLDLLVGRRCRFVTPTCAAEQDLFTVACIQKDHTQAICLRLIGDSEHRKIGRLASPSELIFEDHA